MNKLRRVFGLFAAAALIFAMTATAFAAKKVVAVMPLENVSGWGGEQVAKIVGDQLVSALHRSGSATVVERTQLGNALREIGFGMTGAVDQSTAVQAGKMMGAEYSVVGTVTMANITQNATGQIARSMLGKLGRIFGGSIHQFQGHVAVSIRVISNETGELLKAIDVEGHETGQSPESALFGACKEAAEKFAGELLGHSVGVIVDVDGSVAYIDAGSENGVKKGDKFEIAKELRPITLPNGKMIMKYATIGKLKVTEVHSDYSICEITDSEGEAPISKGAVVRRIQK